MKREEKYRFCLQFGADTEDKIRVGEFLNSLGRKKSEVIVHALIEFQENHPEYVPTNYSRRIQINSISTKDLEEQIRKLIEKQLSEHNVKEFESSKSDPDVSEVSKDIYEMLSDLELFNI